jgi:hypothetical protein
MLGEIKVTSRYFPQPLKTNDGVAGYPAPAPKKFECKNLLLDVFGIKTSSSSLIIFQRAK